MDGKGFQCEESVDREIDFSDQPHFRLLLHHTMLEFYLEDIFIQCYTMNKAFAGTISCQNADDLKLWQWE